MSALKMDVGIVKESVGDVIEQPLENFRFSTEGLQPFQQDVFHVCGFSHSVSFRSTFRRTKKSQPRTLTDLFLNLKALPATGPPPLIIQHRASGVQARCVTSGTLKDCLFPGAPSRSFQLILSGDGAEISLMAVMPKDLVARFSSLF